MRTKNPILPVAELALSEIIADGEDPTADAMHARMDDDPTRLVVMVSAVCSDILSTTAKLTSQAIEYTLKKHGPGYLATEGVAHADRAERQSSETWQRILALRENVLVNVERSVADARAKLQQARLFELDEVPARSSSRLSDVTADTR